MKHTKYCRASLCLCNDHAICPLLSNHPLRRVYVRHHTGKGHMPIGWICIRGNLFIDSEVDIPTSVTRDNYTARLLRNALERRALSCPEQPAPFSLSTRVNQSET